jgi:hypothetical protein
MCEISFGRFSRRPMRRMSQHNALYTPHFAASPLSSAEDNSSPKKGKVSFNPMATGVVHVAL